MRRLLHLEIPRCAFAARALLVAEGLASTKAASRTRSPASKQKKTPRHPSTRTTREKEESTLPGTSVDEETVSTTSAAPSTSPPPWVHNTLHYDPAKVRRLADVLTGSSAAAFTPWASTQTAAAPRGSRDNANVGVKTVEETLRQPVAAMPTSKAPTSRGVNAVVRDAHVKKQREAMVGGNERGSASGENAPIQGWVSALLNSSDPLVAPLTTDLVTFYASLPLQLLPGATVQSSSSPPACASQGREAEAQRTLTALLTTSRLRWQLSTTQAAPLEFTSDTLAEGNVHRLCLVVSSLESAVKLLGKVDSSMVPTVSGHSTEKPAKGTGSGGEGCTAMKNANEQRGEQPAQLRHAWRTARLVECQHLCFSLTTALTSFLAAHRSDSGDLVKLRWDVLLSALLSLVHTTEICAEGTQFMSEALARELTRNGHGTPSGVPVAAGAVDDGEDALEKLFVAVCVALSEWATMMATTSASTPLQPPPLQSTTAQLVPFYAAAASSLRKQLSKVEENTLPNPRWQRSARSESCFQGVTSTLFLFCVVVLRIATVMDARSAQSAAQRVHGANQSTGIAPQSHVDAELHHHDDRHQCERALSGTAAVQLVSDAEALQDALHPLPAGSAQAAHASMHYRTTSAALSGSLSQLWRFADRVRTAEATRRRHGEGSATTSATTPPLPLLVSSHSSFWERHPAHLTVLLRCYYDLLATSGTLLSPTLDPAAPSTSDIAWVVPFYGRLLRLGMALQLDTTLLAAAHLGVEAMAPQAPSTPLEKVVANRTRLRRGQLRQPSAQESDKAPCAAVAAKAEMRWAQVFRLSGAIRVGSCELLYKAVVDISALCAQDPAAAAARLLSAKRSGTVPTDPAVVLIRSTSRVFFAMPRLEFLLGLNTDALSTAEAVTEQSRRVYTACSGVFLWLQELSPSFSSNFKNAPGGQDGEKQPPRGSGGSEQGTAGWEVCGTTPANALEAAFFMTYVLHHWSSQIGVSQLQPLQLVTTTTTTSVAPLMRVWLRDDVTAAMPPCAVDFLLSRPKVESYVAQTLFLLQYNTSRLLRHVRVTGRFHYFTGEVQDKSALMSEPALRQRHVASTLSSVTAFQKQPNFVWMPLESVQEVQFQFAEFPQLVTTPPSMGSGESSLDGHHNTLSYMRSDGPNAMRFSGSSGSHTREYPTVHLGDITCTFARAHAYLVRRLHVLSGILREYRSLLQGSSVLSSSVVREEGKISNSTENGSLSATLQARLSDNATHSPDDEGHRRNNYSWAHPWATMLLEVFTRLPAEMEGTPRLNTGVLRVLERMELVMFHAHQHGLFINVVRTQQQYQAQRRRQGSVADLSPPVDASEEGHAPRRDVGETGTAVQRDADTHFSCAGSAMSLKLIVSRSSVCVPLGVVLDGSARILRVQETVRIPTEAAAATPAESAVTAGGKRRKHRVTLAVGEEQEEIASPFAAALTGEVHGESVKGCRITAVDGVPVATGREVAVQVKDKTTFTFTLERELMD